MTDQHASLVDEVNSHSNRGRRRSGETRDSQSKRLTTTVWVDVTDIIGFVVETLDEHRSEVIDLNEFDKALDKMLWFSILHDGRCWLPLPHWKVMASLTFKALGGKVAVRHGNERLHHFLTRQDRHTNRGRFFREVVQRRFSEGLSDA